MDKIIDDVDALISIWSMRPQPGTPAGRAWVDGCRQGYEWGKRAASPTEADQRDAVLEEAAKAAELCHDFGPSTTDPQRAYFLGLEDAARKIRALK